MDRAHPRTLAKPAPDSPVYTITPGNAVFNNICLNCHGKQADSKGVLAEAISEMTGGDARVANFKDGLLGPPDQVGANIARVFGSVPRTTTTSDGSPVTAEDWAARYLAWMALGGTQRLLPQSLLKIVGATLVMGEPRGKAGIVFAGTPNMLELARNMCSNVLAWGQDAEFRAYFPEKGGRPWRDHTSLLDHIGDAEMWSRLCSVGNRPVVRVPRWKEGKWKLDWRRSFYWGDAYGKRPVLNHRGLVDANGVLAENEMPACVPEEDVRENPDALPLLTADGKPIPTCPAELLETVREGDNPPRAKWALAVGQRPDGGPDFVGRDEWAIRGAANAGIAVLVYLQEVRRGRLAPRPTYDHCEELSKTP
jgi:hypothetical protein